MKEIKPLKNEGGTILVISLIVLALATMIGIAATMTASIELQISGNDMHYTENFYRAEAAVMAGANAIEGSVATVLKAGKYKAEGETGDEITLATEALLQDSDDIANDANWVTGVGSAAAPNALSAEGYNARFLPVKKPPPGSLDMTASTQIHEFTIYGRSILAMTNPSRRLGEVIVEVGYRKRF
jgi:Tfp pilus assembly protein PilX